VHKSGVRRGHARASVARAGFADVERLPDKPWNLSMRAIAA